MRFNTATLAALLCFTATNLWAGPIIYDNGPSNQSGGYFSDLNGFLGDNPRAVADDFSLDPGSNVIGDIHWTGFYYASGLETTDDFLIQIFEDDAGLPGTLVQAYSVGSVNRTLAGTTVQACCDEWDYAVDISPLSLTAGTTYWLSIQNLINVAGSTWTWSLSGAGTGNLLTLANPSVSPWTEADHSVDAVSFYLTAVPEPVILLLFGAGLFGVSLRARRRRKQ